MSLDPEFFVGWYIKATKRYKMVNETMFRCEVSMSHDVKPEYNNCPECGGHVIERINKNRNVITIYDLPDDYREDELEDRFYFPDYLISDPEKIILISNMGAGRHKSYDTRSTIVDVSGAIQAHQYTEFIQEHKDDIELLKEYVYYDLEILYGAFVYYT